MTIQIMSTPYQDLTKVAQSGAPGTCTLSAMQAAAILYNLDEISREQAEIKITLAALQISIDEIKLERARKAGYEQGAGFWFKAGAIAMVVAIGGGFITLVAIMTGKVDFSTIFKIGQ